MKNYIQSLVVIILAAVIVFMASHMTNLYQGPDLPFQIVTAFISVVMMGIVTWILLKGQSGADEGKDKNVKVFQKKLKVYAQFNQELWRVKAKEALTDLLDKCMQELVLVLPYDKMGEMRELLGKLKKEIDSETSNELKAGITAILKADIAGQKREKKKTKLEHAKTIYLLANVFGEEQRIAKEAEPKGNRESDTLDANVALKNEDIQKIWDAYIKGGKQCWHFAAWDNDIQNKALREQNKNVLSLMEYDEDWRTERLKQVNKGDILFLFNRGGDGYVGMYEATGNFIIHYSADGKTTVYKNGCKEEREPEKEEIERYDIYDVYAQDATFVSDVEVKKIKELEGDTSNPINAIRQTIARLSKDNVEKLLKYFDAKETVKNN